MFADKMKRLENNKIKGHFRYEELHQISIEARQKLAKIDPETLAQASRIPGVSPSDINALLVLSGRYRHSLMFHMKQFNVADNR